MRSSFFYMDFVPEPRHSLLELVKAITQIFKQTSFWNRLPDSRLKTHGFSTEKHFLSAKDCEHYIQLFETFSKDDSYEVSEKCYFINRKQNPFPWDQNVSQLINVQDIDNSAKQLMESRSIEAAFRRHFGIDTEVRSLTISKDLPDTATKRGYHNDGVRKVSFKAFIYLTDVLEKEAGPYTVIPGSHRDFLKRSYNCIYNWMINQPLDNMFKVYNDRKSYSFLERRGTLILSTQNLAHKGWHHHTKGTRYALIAYLALKGEAAEFNSGRQRIPSTLKAS